MAQIDVLNFFDFCNSSEGASSNLNEKNLPELMLFSKVAGYRFSVEELTAVVGGMEWHMITEVMKEEMTAYSSLWPIMWGKSRLQYVINDLYLKLGRDKWTEILSIT